MGLNYYSKYEKELQDLIYYLIQILSIKIRMEAE